jgi:hypothetical protein
VSFLRQLGRILFIKKKPLVSIFSIKILNFKYVYIRRYYSPELSFYLFIYLFILSFFLFGGKGNWIANNCLKSHQGTTTMSPLESTYLVTSNDPLVLTYV